MTNLLSRSPCANPSPKPPPHPKFERLLQLRGWTRNELPGYSDETIFQVLFTHGKWILAEKVEIVEGFRIVWPDMVEQRCWKLGTQPIGDTREEAERMLAWLGLAHLPAEWWAIEEIDNSDEIKEAACSHFREHGLAVARGNSTRHTRRPISGGCNP